MEDNAEWKEPLSLNDALERKRLLIDDIEKIQTQLGDRNRQHTSEFETYFKWRQGAKWALTSRLHELRLVKKWINEHQTTYTESETIRNGS